MRGFKSLQAVLLAVLLVLLCAGLSLAADQVRKRDRTKDGSCQSYLLQEDSGKELAANQIRKRDRKKDGSC
jgi:hypothetical protein